MSLGLAGWLGAVASDDATAPVLALGLSGALGTAAALAWPVALGPALLSLAGAYAALLAIDEPTLDTRSVGVGVALLVIGELVGWARELGSATRDEPGGAWRRPIWIAGLGIGALGFAWTLLAVPDLARVEGLGVEIAGALAALAALLLVWRVASSDARD